MTAPLDEKAVALPDELEVVAWRYRPAHVPATAPWAYMDDREPSASFTAEALVCASQAHSTIAALRAEIERLRGLTPELPPYPPEGAGLPRFGLRWNGPAEPLAVPMEDGYWTPYHLASLYRRHCNAAEQELSEVSRGIGSVRWMDPPDGGDVSLGEQVNRMRTELETAEAEVKRLTEEKEALRAENKELRTQDDPTFVHAFRLRAEAAEARIKALEEALEPSIEHIDTLVELLKVIKEHWIDYDHVFSIAVDEADDFLARHKAPSGSKE